jgi:hypothetical protein
MIEKPKIQVVTPGVKFKVWIDGRFEYLTEETMKDERWVKITDWNELKVGGKVKNHLGKQYEVVDMRQAKHTPGEIHCEMKSIDTGDYFGQTLRLNIPPVSTERLSKGHWKPIKSWDELRVGMEVQYNTKIYPEQKEILSIKSIDNAKVEYELGQGHDIRSNFESGAFIMHQWVEGDEESDTDPWKTLKKACTGSEDGWKPKEIPEWPDVCRFCKGPAVALLNAVDCKNKCPESL